MDAPEGGQPQTDRLAFAPSDLVCIDIFCIMYFNIWEILKKSVFLIFFIYYENKIMNLFAKVFFYSMFTSVTPYLTII